MNGSWMTLTVFSRGRWTFSFFTVLKKTWKNPKQTNNHQTNKTLVFSCPLKSLTCKEKLCQWRCRVRNLETEVLGSVVTHHFSKLFGLLAMEVFFQKQLTSSWIFISCFAPLQFTWAFRISRFRAQFPVVSPTLPEISSILTSLPIV